MKNYLMNPRALFGLAVALLCLGAQAAGFDMLHLMQTNPDVALGLAGMAMIGDTQIAEIKALADTQSTLLATTREIKTWMEKAKCRCCDENVMTCTTTSSATFGTANG